MDTLELGVAAETFAKPFQLKVNRVCVDDTLCLDFEEQNLTQIVLALEIVIVRGEIDVLNRGLETIQSLHF